jgi:hypothetical protein
MKRLFIAALFVIPILTIVYVLSELQPNRNVVSAGKQATLLIAKAGGAANICLEANRLFTRFGDSDQYFFKNSDLKDCQAIKTLGKVDGIWPGSPAYIKIRVGNHIDG